MIDRNLRSLERLQDQNPLKLKLLQRRLGQGVYIQEVPRPIKVFNSTELLVNLPQKAEGGRGNGSGRGNGYGYGAGIGYRYGGDGRGMGMGDGKGSSLFGGGQGYGLPSLRYADGEGYGEGDGLGKGSISGGAEDNYKDMLRLFND